MEILLYALAALLGGGASVACTKRFWPTIKIIEVLTPQIKEVPVEVDRIVEIEVPPNPPQPDTRFRIVFYTEGGAAARNLWTSVKPVGDGKMEFYDGPARRDFKEVDSD